MAAPPPLPPGSGARPSRVGYAIAAVFAVAGVVIGVVGVVGGVRSFSGRVDDFQRVDAGRHGPPVGEAGRGQDLRSRLARLLVPIFLALAAFGTAAVLAIVTAVRRSRRA